MTNAEQALAYYYIKTLILRPAVGSTLGPKAAPALMSISESSKHIIQIIQLLEERSMSFSFCLNKADVLVVCGMTLLYQTLELKPESKLFRDDERLVNAVIRTIDRAKVPGCYDFQRIAAMLITVDDPSPQALPTPPRQSPDTSMAAPPARASPPAPMPMPHKAGPYSLGPLPGAAMSETDLLAQQEKLRRMTLPGAQGHRAELQRSQSRSSFDGARRDHRPSLSHQQLLARVSPPQNLDYLPLGSAPGSQPSSPAQARLPRQMAGLAPPPAQLLAAAQLSAKVSAAEWEALLGSMDGGPLAGYDTLYAGAATLPPAETPVSATSLSGGAWSPDSWDLSGFNINEFTTHPGPAQSVLSLSDESLSSGGDDLAAGDLGLGLDFHQGGPAMMPASAAESYILEGLDAAFGL